MSLFLTGLEPLMKLARSSKKKQEDEGESHLSRNLAMGAAAAAPFAGLIGQKPIIHDPINDRSIPRVQSARELSRMAQPGDTIMASRPGGSLWKNFIAPIGESDFYHSQPVIGRRGGYGTTLSAGEYRDPSYKNDKARSINRNAERVHDIEHEYEDLMLLRPKKKLLPHEIKQFAEESVQRAKARYSDSRAVKTYLHEMFMPKIKGLENHSAMPVCEGNVCSTLPGMAYHNIGIPGVPGKAAKNTFPTDFLRNDQFETVAARLKNDYTGTPQARRRSALMTRAGAGAALAASIYGVSKDPALAAVPLGIAGGISAASALNKHLTGRHLPGLLSAYDKFQGATTRAARNGLIGSYAGKTLPAALIGGGLAYLGTNKLRQMLSGENKPEQQTADDH